MENTNAWQLWAATLHRSASRWRKREVSNIVPDATTWCLGRPLSFHVTQAKMSHGLLTTTTTASGLYFTTLGTSSLKIAMFLCVRSRRDSPSSRRTPAVRRITREFCSHSHSNQSVAFCYESLGLLNGVKLSLGILRKCEIEQIAFHKIVQEEVENSIVVCSANIGIS